MVGMYYLRQKDTQPNTAPHTPTQIHTPMAPPVDRAVTRNSNYRSIVGKNDVFQYLFEVKIHIVKMPQAML